MVDKKSKKILAANYSSGKTHDFKLFKQSKLNISEKTRIDLDLGYKGMEKIHGNARIPIKSSKYHRLTKTEVAYNKRLSRSRVFVEHVIRKVKIFRIVAERYRNRRKRFGLRMNLIAGLYNFEIS